MLGFAGIVQSGNRGTPLLLDTYSGAAAAYSLRKLRTAYTGSAVRVRRSTDSVEQDIGFDANGNLDESTLQTFCGENLLQRSEEFDNAYWNKLQSSITANSSIAPDGTTTADKINTDTSNNFHLFYAAFFSNIPFCASIYAKKAEYNWLIISSDIGGTNVKAYFDLSNGVLGTVESPLVATIESASNGFYRCSITRSSGSGLGGIAFWVSPSNNTSSFVGDTTKGIYLWGAQLNTGSLKPYVQTTTAARDGMGYVTKWYDQSGNARDAAQTTAANQPRLVNAGVVEKKNNKATLMFDGTNDYMLITVNVQNLLLNNNTISAFSSLTVTGATNNLINSDNGANGRMAILPSFSGSYYFDVGNDTTARLTGTQATFSNLTLINFIRSGSDMYYYRNASLIGSKNNASGTLSNPRTDIALGARIYTGNNIDGYYTGNLCELILYPSDQSASRTAIESNINTYFNIY